MSKKIISILTIFVLIVGCIFCTSGCSKQDNRDNPIEIDYLKSTDDLEEYKNKFVCFTGYMTLWSASDLKTAYIVNIPTQKGPAVSENGVLANSIAINSTSELTYYDAPVKVVGKLVFGNFFDENGISYDCKVVDSTVERIDPTNLPQNIKDAETILYKNHLEKAVYSMYMLGEYVYYKDNSTPTKDLEIQIDFYDYETIINDLSDTKNETVEDFLDVINEINQLCTNVNDITSKKEFDKLDTLQDSFENTANKLDNLINALILKQNRGHIPLFYCFYVTYFNYKNNVIKK